MGNLPREPVAWATVDPVPDSGRVWAALSGLHPQTGLVPIQLDGMRVDTMFLRDRRGLPGDALRPWDSGEFFAPEDPREADRVDVAVHLEDVWRDWASWFEEDDPETVERRAPFTLQWPAWPCRSTRR